RLDGPLHSRRDAKAGVDRLDGRRIAEENQSLLLQRCGDDGRDAHEAYRPGEGVRAHDPLDVVAVHQRERVEAEHRVGAPHVDLAGARLFHEVGRLDYGVARADDVVDDYRVPPL